MNRAHILGVFPCPISEAVLTVEQDTNNNNDTLKLLNEPSHDNVNDDPNTNSINEFTSGKFLDLDAIEKAAEKALKRHERQQMMIKQNSGFQGLKGNSSSSLSANSLSYDLDDDDDERYKKWGLRSKMKVVFGLSRESQASSSNANQSNPDSESDLNRDDPNLCLPVIRLKVTAKSKTGSLGSGSQTSADSAGGAASGNLNSNFNSSSLSKLPTSIFNHTDEVVLYPPRKEQNGNHQQFPLPGGKFAWIRKYEDFRKTRKTVSVYTQDYFGRDSKREHQESVIRNKTYRDKSPKSRSRYLGGDDEEEEDQKDNGVDYDSSSSEFQSDSNMSKSEKDESGAGSGSGQKSTESHKTLNSATTLAKRLSRSKSPKSPQRSLLNDDSHSTTTHILPTWSDFILSKTYRPLKSLSDFSQEAQPEKDLVNNPVFALNMFECEILGPSFLLNKDEVEFRVELELPPSEEVGLGIVPVVDQNNVDINLNSTSLDSMMSQSESQSNLTNLSLNDINREETGIESAETASTVKTRRPNRFAKISSAKYDLHGDAYDKDTGLPKIRATSTFITGTGITESDEKDAVNTLQNKLKRVQNELLIVESSNGPNHISVNESDSLAHLNHTVNGSMSNMSSRASSKNSASNSISASTNNSHSTSSGPNRHASYLFNLQDSFDTLESRAQLVRMLHILKRNSTNYSTINDVNESEFLNLDSITMDLSRRLSEWVHEGDGVLSLENGREVEEEEEEDEVIEEES